MNQDILYGLRNVGVALVIFLCFIAVAQTENFFVTVLAFTAGCALLGAAISYIKDKAVDIKWTVGWGVIGLIAGILFALAV